MVVISCCTIYIHRSNGESGLAGNVNWHSSCLSLSSIDFIKQYTIYTSIYICTHWTGYRNIDYKS